MHMFQMAFLGKFLIFMHLLLANLFDDISQYKRIREYKPVNKSKSNRHCQLGNGMGYDS